MEKKKVERHFVEKARQTSSLIPKGEIVESEGPDFLIETGSEILGIEVTQLFQPSPAGAFPKRAVESFQDKVTREAEEVYQKSGGRSVDVLVFFDEKSQGQVGCRSMAKALADFVKNHYGAERDAKTYQHGDVPAGFSVIRIARPLDGTNKWQAGKFGCTVRLKRSFLADEIKRKNRLVPKYRERVSRVWLLIIASFLPLSGSFSVPNEIETWDFSFDFDKVLLLSEEDNKVFEVSCVNSKAARSKYVCQKLMDLNK